MKFVRAGHGRSFVCKTCAREAEVLRSFGTAATRFPNLCSDCEPTAPVWRRQRAEAPLRAAIITLAAQVDDLLAAADEGGGDGFRARQFGPPSREVLTLAVRRVAASQGRYETANALLDLGAVARAWASSLTGTPSLPTVAEPF